MNAAVRTGSGITFGRHALPKPPGVGQVKIRVKAASINPVDYKVGKFLLGPIAGLDVAGVVERVGDGVDSFKPGDAVFGFTSGSCCELTVADAAKLALVPPSLDFTNAAALDRTSRATSRSSSTVNSEPAGKSHHRRERRMRPRRVPARARRRRLRDRRRLQRRQRVARRVSGRTRVVAYDDGDGRRRYSPRVPGSTSSTTPPGWRGRIREPVSRDGRARGRRRHQRRRVEVDRALTGWPRR